jgi:hypothetical protein
MRPGHDMTLKQNAFIKSTARITEITTERGLKLELSAHEAAQLCNSLVML